MNYLKHGQGTSSPADELRMEAKPLTKKTDMPRASWGSVISSLQTVPGLCSSPKCVRKASHAGACWPS